MAIRFSQGDNVIIKERGGESVYPVPPDEVRGMIARVEFCVDSSQEMGGDQMHYGELFTGLGESLYAVGVGGNAYVMHESWLVGVVKVKVK